MNKKRIHSMKAIPLLARPRLGLLTPLFAALVLAGCASALPAPAEHAGVDLPTAFSSAEGG
jgi:hypothetical protein